MILRDQSGQEVQAGIGDLFHYQNCILEIVCPDSEASELFGKQVLCVRLSKGILEHQGQTHSIVEGKNPPLFIFESDLVATCLSQRPKVEPTREPIAHPPEFDAIKPYQEPKPEAKTPRAKKSTARPEEDRPTLW